MCSARRRGRSTAAPPAEMQRRNGAAVVARADPTSQVQLTCYRLDAKHAEALRPSILILITPTLLFLPFIKLPCPCHARCPGNPV